MLGTTIAHLRKQKGLTQAELAGKIEVHPSLLAKWERNLVQPRTKALERVAVALETSVQELMAGDFSGITATLNEMDDPELITMVSQIHKLNAKEREALKTVMGAMLARAQVAEMVAR